VTEFPSGFSSVDTRTFEYRERGYLASRSDARKDPELYFLLDSSLLGCC